MITVKDVKIHKKTSDSTIIQKWDTYWFNVNGKISFGIERQDGIFKFFAKHCKSLDDAKQYIADYLNNGNRLQSI